MRPVVAVDGGGYPAEGYSKRDFDICTGVEATGIPQAWQEGGPAGSRQRQVISGDGAVAMDMGNDQVSRGIRG